MSLRPITEYEMRTAGVVSLPTRPTAPREFGGRGYSPTELKESFDRLPRLIAERYNELIEHITDGDYLSDVPFGDMTLDSFLEDTSDRLAAAEETAAELTNTVSNQEERLTLLDDHADRIAALEADAALARAVLDSTLLSEVETEDTYVMRLTADGLPLVDGAISTVKRVTGSTVASANNILDMSFMTNKNGLTVTNDKNMVTVVGTQTSGGASSWEIDRDMFEDGQTYTFCTIPNYADCKLRFVITEALKADETQKTTYQSFANGNITVTFDKKKYKYYCYFSTISSKTDYDVKTGVMCVKGSVAPTVFEPYFKGVKNAQFKGINSTGTNLIPYPYYDGTQKTMYNTAFQVLEDGRIAVSGTPTNVALFNLFYNEKEPLFLAKGTQIYAHTSQRGFFSIGTKIIGSTKTFDTQDLANHVLENDTYITKIDVRFFKIGSSIPENAIVDPRITIGDAILPYEPYKSDTSFALAAPVELGAWDYIDVDRQKMIRQTEIISFDGMEAWSSLDQNGTHAVEIAHADNSLLTTGNYTVVEPPGDTPPEDGTCYMSDGMLTICDHSCTAETWPTHLAALAAAGNPLTIAYMAPIAIEEDISIPHSYTAWKGGSETIVQGNIDHAKYGAMPTVCQSFYTIQDQGVTA